MALRVLRKVCQSSRLIASCTQQFHTLNYNFQKWDLMSGVCLERYPIISAELNDFEKKYDDFMKQLDHERSSLSKFEVQTIQDKAFLKKIQSADYEETEADSMRVTTQELEDKWEMEFNEFKPASRLTKADEDNDRKSLERKLDSKLFLVVQKKVGEKFHWIFPCDYRLEGESMREVAERTLKEVCGDKLKAQIMGNAPCGFSSFKYPKELQSDTIGAKVFYYKAHFQSGQVTEKFSAKDIHDYMWLTKAEVEEHLVPQMSRKVKKFIFDV